MHGFPLPVQIPARFHPVSRAQATAAPVAPESVGVRPGPPLASEILASLRPVPTVPRKAASVAPEDVRVRPGPPLASEILARFRVASPVQRKATSVAPEGVRVRPGPPLASEILAHLRVASPVQRKAASVAPEGVRVRPGPPLAGQILAAFRNKSLAPRPVQGKAAATAIQRMEEDALDRVHNTYERNLDGKAQPLSQRDYFDVQSQSNYGYDNRHIDYGGSTADFKKGWGGQPFLIKANSDYDKIVSVILVSGVSQPDIAEAILAKIDDKSSTAIDDVSNGKPSLKAAMENLIYLTQTVEAHESRAPGWDKVARTLLEGIVNHRRNFAECFNRKNGLFLPAWKKKAGATCGGQEAVRAFMSLVRKKSDNRKIDDGYIISLVPELPEELKEYMSDSSEED